jgi:hypothetical protein
MVALPPFDDNRRLLLLIGLTDFFHTLDDSIGGIADLLRGDNPRLSDPIIRKLSIGEE